MPANVEVTTPSDLEVTVTRVFNAPARRVYDAHTKPELVKKWLLGPDGWSMPVCEIDARVGGTYRYRWRNNANPEQEFGTGGEFTEVEAPHRIVQTERMEGFDGQSLCTMILTEHNRRTTLSITQKFETKQARDGAMATGMTDGMAASYDRLEEEVLDKEAA